MVNYFIKFNRIDIKNQTKTKREFGEFYIKKVQKYYQKLYQAALKIKN